MSPPTQVGETPEEVEDLFLCKPEKYIGRLHLSRGGEQRYVNSTAVCAELTLSEEARESLGWTGGLKKCEICKEFVSAERRRG